MDIISVLPEKTAQLIAAGEVVENPASVVKELVENSIDAGATSIKIEIMNGGISMIRVTDNGKGMSANDAVNCFLRHATSKVRTADDITCLSTLGFRGEALASIAAVSKVRLSTATEGVEEGTTVCMEGGILVEKDAIPCNKGTIICVKDLFYNTPARKKFLKSERAEAGAVASLIDRLSLSHPDVTFKFTNNGKEELFTPGNGELKDAIISVWGSQSASQVLEVKSTGDISVNGYISKPLFSKGNRHLQLFYINGRMVSSRVLSAALEDAYKNSIMVGKYPACVLNVVVDASFVDVNVHPSKSIVKFSDDRRVYNSVYNAAVFALSTEKQQYTAKTAIVDDKIDKDVITALEGFVEAEAKQIQMDIKPVAKINEQGTKKDNVFETSKATPVIATEINTTPKKIISISNDDEIKCDKDGVKLVFNDVARVVVDEHTNEKVIEIYKNKLPPMINIPTVPEFTVIEEAKNDEIIEEPTAPIEYIGEVLNSFIITQSGDEVYIIDKHAAHERLIFEQLKKSDQKVSRQMLLISQTILMDRSDKDLLLENAQVLENCGFEIEDSFGNSISLKACPGILVDDDVESVLLEIADSIKKGKSKPEIEKMNKILEITSCKAAIKAGQRNGIDELKKLVDDIFAIPDIKYCPHGRPIIYTLTRKDFEKFFKRIV